MSENEKCELDSYGLCRWIGLAATVAILIALIAYIFPGFARFLSGANTAAWIQAIGSIIAIGVAIVLARHQALTAMKSQQSQWERARNDRLRHRKESLLAMAETTGMAAGTISRICDRIVNEIVISPELARASMSPIRKCSNMLGKLATHKTPGILLARHVLDLLLRAEECLIALEAISVSLDLNQNDVQRNRIRDVGVQASKIKKSLDKVVDAYDGT